MNDSTGRIIDFQIAIVNYKVRILLNINILITVTTGLVLRVWLCCPVKDIVCQVLDEDRLGFYGAADNSDVHNEVVPVVRLEATTSTIDENLIVVCLCDWILRITHICPRHLESEVCSIFCTLFPCSRVCVERNLTSECVFLRSITDCRDFSCSNVVLFTDMEDVISYELRAVIVSKVCLLYTIVE